MCCRLRTCFGSVDEDLKGLRSAIFINSYKRFSQRSFNGVGIAMQCARAWFFAVLPEGKLGLLPGFEKHEGWRSAQLFLLHGRLGFEHNLVTRSGDVNGDALAAQFPG